MPRGGWRLPGAMGSPSCKGGFARFSGRGA